MAPVSNLAAKGSGASIHVRAALNFTDAVNEAITLDRGDHYARLRDVLTSDSRIESAPSSLKPSPEQSLTHSVGEQLAMLDGMKAVLKEFHVNVEKIVDGGKEVVMFGNSDGRAHSGKEFKDDRVILVQTTGDESDVTTAHAQGSSDDGREGLPRIVYVKEFIDSAYLLSFLAGEQAATGAKEAAT